MWSSSVSQEGEHCYLDCETVIIVVCVCSVVLGSVLPVSKFVADYYLAKLTNVPPLVILVRTTSIHHY